MIVVLLIISILTAAAVPRLQKQALRKKEYQLRRDILAVRESIDRFHRDWRTGLINENATGVSRDGFPTDWEALVSGVQGAQSGSPRRYLRSIPENPFAPEDEEPWILLGYRDAPQAGRWGGLDIYDLRANTDRVALDGTAINDW